MTRWAPPRDARFANLAVFALVLAVAVILRVYGLTVQSLWLDELFSVVFSRSELSVADIVRVYADDVHPLGYPLLLHWWLVLFGDSELAARSLSALFGVLGIPVMYLVGRRLGGPTVGLIAATLTAVNGFHIEYSQEARSYSLVFLLAALSYAALVDLLHRPRWQAAVAFGAVASAAAHVHYYSLVMLVGQAVATVAVLIVRRAGWSQWLWAALAAAMIVVAVLPWLGPLRQVAAMNEYWPKPPTPWFIVGYFQQYFGNDLGLSLVMAGLLVGGIAVAMVGTGPDREVPPTRLVAWLLGASVAVSLLVAYLRSVMVVPMLMPRFTLVFLPALLILISIGAAAIRPSGFRLPMVVAIAVLSVAGLVRSGYYTEPRKEQWREAVGRMVTDPRFDSRRDACLAVLAPGFRFYVDRSQPGFAVGDATLEGLQAVLDEEPRPVVWLLLARNERPSRGFRRLQREHWVRTDRVQLLKTSVERWQPVE
jgi:uncharacterized membrane protein